MNTYTASRVGSQLYLDTSKLPAAVIRTVWKGEEHCMSTEEIIENGTGQTSGWLRADISGSCVSILPVNYTQDNTAEIIFSSPLREETVCGFGYKGQMTDEFTLPKALTKLTLGVSETRPPVLKAVISDDDILTAEQPQRLARRAEEQHDRMKVTRQALELLGGSEKVMALLDEAERLMAEAEQELKQLLCAAQAESDSCSCIVDMTQGTGLKEGTNYG